jgi:hypothetical protein
VAALGADLPKQASLAERPTSREVIVLERPDALGHEPVEAPYLPDVRVVDSLILVRDLAEQHQPVAETPGVDPRRRDGHRFALAAGSQRNIGTTTLRAFDQEQFQQILNNPLRPSDRHSRFPP